MATAREPAAALPERLRTRLDGRRLDEPEPRAIVLASAGTTRRPHVALLSRAEVVAVSESRLRIALHAGSRTAANLAETGAATLLLADSGEVDTIAIDARVAGRTDVAGTELLLFDARATEVRSHAVPYAHVTSGITFSLVDPPPTLERWRATVAALRDGEEGA